jgi:threonine dehydratase
VLQVERRTLPGETAELVEARSRLLRMILPTPLEPAPAALAAYAGDDDLWLKREDVHELGMFKWRAALPVVRELAREGHTTIVTSSTGNHGAAVAWACREHGSRAIVFVPPGSTESKLALLRSLDADVRVEGEDFDAAKHHAHVWARSEGLPFFEDGAEPLQYEAYRAIGDEILDQLDAPPAAVVTPIGNGALAGGVGAALARSPATTRVGVVAKDMPVMAESLDAERPVDVGPGSTIADGLAVRVAIPLAVSRLRETVDLMLRVSEREIAAALVTCHEAGVEVEPSAAAALAAARTLDTQGSVVLVITGRNFDPAILERARTDLDSFPD